MKQDEFEIEFARRAVEAAGRKVACDRLRLILGERGTIRPQVRDWWTGRARIERETTQNSRRLIVGVAGWFK